jgi:zinc protease
MKALLLTSILLCLPFASFAQNKKQKESKLIPYDQFVDDLPNGLRVVTVPTDYPNLVAFYVVVQTGSRNEIEPGKSGYAHFFEHLMFRGSKNYTAQQRDEILKRAGSKSNANTSDDRTIYYDIISKEDLDQVLKLESDRFKGLQYSEPGFKTEALAILGEYNKNISNPTTKLDEVARNTAFTTHTYTHTTLGFLKDIQDMPNQYKYSIEFYNRYYRPEYTTIVMVGDIKRDQSLQLVNKYFSDWQRGNYKPDVPAEPAQTEPKTNHVEWDSETLPYIAISFHGPAYSDTNKDKAALDLLASIAFGQNSELYQKLVLQEQKVDFLSDDFADRVDPELFSVVARVKNPADLDYVKDQILATFKKYSTDLVPQEKLDATRSRQRYGTSLALDSSEAIARFLAEYIALTRSPATVDKLFALYDTITPADIRAAAAKYFVDNSRTIVTLSHGNSASKGGQK